MGGDEDVFTGGGAHRPSEAERDAARLLQHSLEPAVLLDAFPKSVIKGESSAGNQPVNGTRRGLWPAPYQARTNL